MDLLRAVPWWTGQTTEITAELVMSGYIRIFATSEAGPLVEALASDLNAMPKQASFEDAQIMQDRYRSLKLYSDGRLRFTKEIAIMLGFKLGDRPSLFVQNFAKGLEIMTLSFREQRLTSGSAYTIIGLHLME
jgi:hypothetical protein